jgi:hypothetical protein
VSIIINIVGSVPDQLAMVQADQRGQLLRTQQIDVVTPCENLYWYLSRLQDQLAQSIWAEMQPVTVSR